MKLSVVCPYYNEAQIVGEAVTRLLAALEGLPMDAADWELLVVNDGSLDGSGEVVAAIEHPRLRPLGYRFNRGRGFALRTGIAAARGAVVVTTEIDLSWGEDIVERLWRAMEEQPEADIVVASPHLPGGGYKNVPPKRVWLSKMGNKVIRACMTNAATMNTGMTRAYRREVIQSMPLYEDKKEFHLEVLLKANAFGLRVHEIPSLLEWKQYKHQGQRVKRKSSSRVNRLIVSHSLFSLFANPVRYVWAMSLVGLFLAGLSGVAALVLWAMDAVAAYTALLSISLFVFSTLLFVLGVVLKQGNMVQREIWTLQRDQLMNARRGNPVAEASAASRTEEPAEAAG